MFRFPSLFLSRRNPAIFLCCRDICQFPSSRGSLSLGSVKTAILTASNVASYFEKVTLLLMVIGRTCPTIDRLGTLYKGHLNVQKALCDYFAIIVRLCSKILQVSRRSNLIQNLSSIFSPFETDFGPFESQLKQAVTNIQLVTSVASKEDAVLEAKLEAHEREESRSHRQLSRLFHRDARHEIEQMKEWRLRASEREAMKIRQAAMDNLSRLDHVKRWREICGHRVPGTADWIQTDPGYLDWRDDDAVSILWLTGHMGTGKSTVMSSVVSHLLSTRRTSDVVSSFFCHSDVADHRTARSVIGSIARQIFGACSPSMSQDFVSDLGRQESVLSLDSIIDTIDTMLRGDKTCFVVVDGIDDCEAGEANQLVRALSRLQSQRPASLKIVVSARTDVYHHFSEMLKADRRIHMTSKSVEIDIRTYIEQKLDECLEHGRLKLGDPLLIEHIQDTLVAKADGMFLWVTLVIEELCSHNISNDAGILLALDKIPTQLSELFNRKLERVLSRSSSPQSVELLKFCWVVKEPLTAQQYRELLSVERGQTSMDRNKMPHDMASAAGGCGGLVFEEEEDNTLRFIHQSVRSHLFNLPNLENIPSFSAQSFDRGSIDLCLGILCITYLNFNDFKRQISIGTTTPDTAMQPLKIGMIATNVKLSNRIARAILEYRKTKPVTCNEFKKLAEDAIGMTSSSAEDPLSQQFVFLKYAQEFWLEHCRRLDPDEKGNDLRLFWKCVDDREIPAHRPWDDPEYKTLETRLGIHGFGEPSSMPIFLPTIQTPSKQVKPWFETPEEVPESLAYLLVSGTRALAGRLRGFLAYRYEASWWVVLLELCNGRCVESVRTLLNLHLPAFEEVLTLGLSDRDNTKHLRIVELMLEAVSDREFCQTMPGIYFALQIASSCGHERIVERIIQSGANVNAHPAVDRALGIRKASEMKSHLGAAVSCGKIDVARMLLAAGAQVDALTWPIRDFALDLVARKYMTALHIAISDRDPSMTHLLLSFNADPNIYTGQRTALGMALEKRELSIADALLKAGADLHQAFVPLGEQFPIDPLEYVDLHGMSSRFPHDALTDFLHPRVRRGGRSTNPGVAASANPSSATYQAGSDRNLDSDSQMYGPEFVRKRRAATESGSRRQEHKTNDSNTHFSPMAL